MLWPPSSWQSTGMRSKSSWTSLKRKLGIPSCTISQLNNCSCLEPSEKFHHLPSSPAVRSTQKLAGEVGHLDRFVAVDRRLSRPGARLRWYGRHLVQFRCPLSSLFSSFIFGIVAYCSSFFLWCSSLACCSCCCSSYTWWCKAISLAMNTSKALFTSSWFFSCASSFFTWLWFLSNICKSTVWKWIKVFRKFLSLSGTLACVFILLICRIIFVVFWGGCGNSF